MATSKVAVKIGLDLLGGGQFVFQRRALTIASVVHGLNMSDMRVRLGSNSSYQGGHHQRVRDVIEHPSFSPNNTSYNLLLLRMDRNVSYQIARHISFLARIPFGYDKSFGYTTGYGKNYCSSCDQEAEITAKEIELIRKSWICVEGNYLGTGNAVFRELFCAHPKYMKFFEKMKCSPDQDLFQSERFEKHITCVLFPSIAQILKNLDSPDKLKAQFNEIGVNHEKRNLKRKHFEALHKAVLIAFQKELGNKLTCETAAAWDKILTVTFDQISTTMEECRPKCKK